MKKKQETKELCLDDILNRIEGIKTEEEPDETITVTSKNLKADISFFIPTMEDLKISADKETGTVTEEGAYLLLTHLVATPIKTEWLEALKVSTNLEVIKFLFKPNEAYVIFGMLSESMPDVGGIIKKN